jgi:Fe2+ or Zn2+ uptake regulation protein
MKGTSTKPSGRDEVAAALRAAGYRVTPQRLMIHRTLVELGRHVGAEELVKAVEQ